MICIDPRTHLLVLLLTSIAAMILNDPGQVNFLTLLSAFYLLGNGLPKKAMYYSCIYIVLKLLLCAFTPYAFGTLTTIIYTFARMIPMCMIGAALLHESPSAIMCAYAKMHFPKPILVMICILARFFPVVMMEMIAIKDGMRARGIFPHWHSVFRRPALAYECFLMPLIVRCLKLSEELASSAEMRGIECNCRRTSVHQVGFKVADGIAASSYSLIIIGIYRWGAMPGWLN